MEPGRPFPRLEKAADPAKDQSYFLARLSRKQLTQILCPLAGLTKTRSKPWQPSIIWYRSRQGKQDICFIHEKNLADFFSDRIGLTSRPGPIIDSHGRQVGTHTGVHAFTVGQRRGLNCPAAEPYYVRRIDPADHTLHVCFKKDLARQEMTVDQMVWHDTVFEETRKVSVKIRYRHKEVDAS